MSSHFSVPLGPEGDCFSPPGAELGVRPASAARGLHRRVRAVPGTFPPLCQEAHDVGVDTSSLLSPGSAWVYFVYLFTRSAYTAAFFQFLVIKFFCSLRCPEAVSSTCCNSVAGAALGHATFHWEAEMAEFPQVIDLVSL